MQDNEHLEANTTNPVSGQRKSEPPPLPIFVTKPKITEKVIIIFDKLFKKSKKVCIRAFKENRHLYKIFTTKFQVLFTNQLIKKIPDSERLKAKKENLTFTLSQLKTYSPNWWLIITTWLVIFAALKIVHFTWKLLFN
ncbi:MAG: hypothetical protein RLZ10_1861 [Bacteroidota bacterium]|jgi:hypothetical protein